MLGLEDVDDGLVGEVLGEVLEEVAQDAARGVTAAMGRGACGERRAFKLCTVAHVSRDVFPICGAPKS